MWWIAGLFAFNFIVALALYFKPRAPRLLTMSDIIMAMRVWPHDWMRRK